MKKRSSTSHKTMVRWYMHKGRWLHASVHSLINLSPKKSEVRGKGRKGDSHQLSSGSKSPKSSVVNVFGWGMMGRMSEGQLERRGWGYEGQHGGMVSGIQMLTYQAYRHHSKSYIHIVYHLRGPNERFYDCGTDQKAIIMGGGWKR